MTDDNSLSNELADIINRFLLFQIESNGQLSSAAQESLTVAAECLEQAYDLQRRSGSRELLDIYKSHKQQAASAQSSSTQAQSNFGANPASFIQNLASNILSQGLASATNLSSGSTSGAAAPSAPQQPPTNTPAPRVRKQATQAEKLAAESFKNQGNELMKQDKYREAFDSYTQAIDIDDNNAIYYSNRAAASAKLGDHHAALRDCQEAIEIDVNYSKAYGRMGLAYASLEDHQKAKDAYLKAVELDPTNESYKNNLSIAEAKLIETSAGTPTNQGDVMTLLRSMMSNPEVINIGMRSLQDPRIQSLFGMGGQPNAGQNQPSAPPSTPSQQTESTATQQANHPTSESNATNQQQQPQQPSMNPADLLNLASRISRTGNMDLVGAGQQLLSSIEQNNPDLVQNMRRMMDQVFMPPNQNNEHDRNPPPGYS